LPGQVANRRQAAARRESPDGDHHRDLGPDLLEAGDDGVCVEAQHQASFPARLVGEVDYGR